MENINNLTKKEIFQYIREKLKFRNDNDKNGREHSTHRGFNFAENDIQNDEILNEFDFLKGFNFSLDFHKGSCILTLDDFSELSLSGLTTTEIIFTIFQNTILKDKFINDCENHKMVYVNKIMTNNSNRIIKQCIICGSYDYKAEKISKALDFWSVTNIFEIPLFDENKYIIFENKRENFYIKKRQEKSDFFESNKNKYLDYLKSKEWIQKRNLIMQKYKNKCVLCFSPAEVVHHLHYRNIYNEDFRDLISLCKDCHSYIHDIKD
jgi:hypothetical protein